MMIRTALYFGSFNPIHNGHIAVAQHVVEHGLCDELWFVVSPQNPLKPLCGLAAQDDRMNMVQLAVSQMACSGVVDVCGIEFELPKPSYTIDTLNVLVAKYPQRCFSLLIGGDIIGQLDQWRDYTEILDRFQLLVYPRAGYSIARFADRITLLDDAPQWSYSSTSVREYIRLSKDISKMVPSPVYQYIKDHKLWT